MKLTKAEKNVAIQKFDELVIDSLIHSIWHNNFNFEVYIKWMGILPNNKRKTVENLMCKETKNHQHITRGYVFLPVLSVQLV